MVLSFNKLNEESLDYVWENMREYDRKELEIQSFNESQAKSLVNELHAYVLKDSSSLVPVAVGGVLLKSWPLYGAERLMLWGFGTDETYKHMPSVHKYVKRFIGFLERTEWHAIPSVLVWEKHNESRRWLTHLGFRDSDYGFSGLNNERIVLMEKLSKCVDQPQLV